MHQGEPMMNKTFTLFAISFLAVSLIFPSVILAQDSGTSGSDSGGGSGTSEPAPTEPAQPTEPVPTSGDQPPPPPPPAPQGCSQEVDQATGATRTICEHNEK